VHEGIAGIGTCLLSSFYSWLVDWVWVGGVDVHHCDPDQIESHECRPKQFYKSVSMATAARAFEFMPSGKKPDNAIGNVASYWHSGCRQAMGYAGTRMVVEAPPQNLIGGAAEAGNIICEENTGRQGFCPRHQFHKDVPSIAQREYINVRRGT